MVRLRFFVWLFLAWASAVAVSAAAAQTADTVCSDLMQASAPIVTAARAVRAEDLVSLRDIGDPSPAFESAGLDISPDGRSIAFPIRRAAPDTNDYCLGVVRLDLAGNGKPILVDSSRQLVREGVDGLGRRTPSEYPTTVQPRWSPSGKWIAYLKSVDTEIRLWGAHADGGGAQPIRGTDRARDFRWVDDDTIVYTLLPPVPGAAPSLSQERVSGFYYDERFTPNMSDLPFPEISKAPQYEAISLSTGVARAARDAERALFAPSVPKGAVLAAHDDRGNLAWSVKAHPERYASGTMLTVAFRGARALTCGPDRCGRIARLWWTGGKDTLVFLRHEGWANSMTGIYLWRRGQSAPRQILATQDVLLDCKPLARALICGHESALRPRTIVQISLRSGATRTLFDPNPGFAELTTGRVERLHWTNAKGLKTFGDLVYPVGYQRGEKYPAIVTTYTSLGFLRGATGDEYPIQLFANHGFAVLSFSRPVDVGLDTEGVPDQLTAHRMAYKDWADRRSVQSAVEGGLDLMDRKGLLDRTRVGITGLSDGSTTVQFALLNSDIFSAAVMSSCCLDAHAMLSDSGPKATRYFRSTGYPSLDAPQSDAWRDMSFTLSPTRLHAPLLMQLSSDEFRWALSGFTTLREHHKPVEMYVFPDEGHIKQQPAHRLAIYRRNLAWFEFWLKDRDDSDLVTPEELKRWHALRKCFGALARGCRRVS